MSDRLKRVLWSIPVLPLAALTGFLVGGHAAALSADSASGLADAASVAIVGITAAVVALGLATWALLRLRVNRLPRLALIMALAAGLGVWYTQTQHVKREAERLTEQ